VNAIQHPLSPRNRTAVAKIREAAAGAPKGQPDRATFDETIGHRVPPDDVAFEAAEVGSVPGWWCRPKDASTRNVILYLHGGAYALGSTKAYKSVVGQIAKRAGSVAFIPDYGLAPEQAFPRHLFNRGC